MSSGGVTSKAVFWQRCFANNPWVQKILSGVKVYSLTVYIWCSVRNSKKTHFSLSFQLLVGNCLHTLTFFPGLSKEFVQLFGVFLSNPATVTIPFGSLLTSACATFSVSSAPSFWQLDYETINPSQFWQSSLSLNQHMVSKRGSMSMALHRYRTDRTHSPKLCVQCFKCF